MMNRTAQVTEFGFCLLDREDSEELEVGSVAASDEATGEEGLEEGEAASVVGGSRGEDTAEAALDELSRSAAEGSTSWGPFGEVEKGQTAALSGAEEAAVIEAQPETDLNRDATAGTVETIPPGARRPFTSSRQVSLASFPRSRLALLSPLGLG
jgi:hypothetical protein